MTGQQRRDEAYAVWRELEDVRGRCWQVGVGDVEAAPEWLQKLGEDLQRLGQRLVEAAKIKS